MTPDTFTHLASAWIMAVSHVAMLGLQQIGLIFLSVVVLKIRLRQTRAIATQDQHEERIQGVEAGVQTALAAAPPPVLAAPIIIETRPTN